MPIARIRPSSLVAPSEEKERWVQSLSAIQLSPLGQTESKPGRQPMGAIFRARLSREIMIFGDPVKTFSNRASHPSAFVGTSTRKNR